MIEIQFVPLTPLITVDVLLEHRRKHIAKMIFDTGATFTTITPEIALKLGFDLQKTARDQIVYTANKAISAFRFIIPCVYLQNEKVSDHEVRCMALPKELRVDGLLGLNFLRHFNICLDFESGLLTLERIPGSS
jgi:clan AA aspartic protease (TIGR02281 family)